MADAVAIVTGACSGIGLALTRHLLSKGWRVILADINEDVGQKLEIDLGPKAIFIKTDVASWESQAALFQQAFTWSEGRLDFLAANAGLGDLSPPTALFESAVGAPPKKSNLLPIEVNTIGTIYSVELFVHYTKMAKTKGGKIIITASEAGSVPVPFAPLYSASKHSLIGYTRSLGPTFMKLGGIAVNAIAPNFVDTAIISPQLRYLLPEDIYTTMDMVIQAFDLYLDDKSGRTGEILEISGPNFAVRPIQEPVDEYQRLRRIAVEESFKKKMGA